MQKPTKTKIIATIGPSTWDDTVLRSMINNGMNGARINASFADFAELDRVSKQIRTISPEVAIILDTMGHKVRVTGFEEEITVKTGDRFVMASEGVKSDRAIKVTYPTLARDITRGAKILIDDGNISVTVDDIQGDEVFCTVIQGGILKKKKTVNIPGVHLNFPALSDKDRGDIQFAVQNGFDYVSASFIRNTQDVKLIREAMGSTDTKLIAKIEDQEGVQNFDQILEVVDGIMVARGDLGVELPIESVPSLQKEFIAKCEKRGKLVIVATQMLESMRENTRPTRAEASDVANAVWDGADVLMLSAETSTGKYPIEAVKTMQSIIREAEKSEKPKISQDRTSASLETDILCKHLAEMTNELDLAGILVITKTGNTIASLSRHNLSVPIWSITTNAKLAREQNLYRGVRATYINDFPADRDVLTKTAVNIVYSKGEVDVNALVAVIYGSSISGRSTNGILELVRVGECLQ